MRSEAELDERLQQLHYRIEHESIPLNEEKRILQQIKKLDAQRQKVPGAAGLGSAGGWARGVEVQRLRGLGGGIELKFQGCRSQRRGAGRSVEPCIDQACGTCQPAPPPACCPVHALRCASTRPRSARWPSRAQR